MTSKKELKELIELLREDIRELKTELGVIKTLVSNNNTITAFPFIQSSENIIYKDPNSTGQPYPTYPTITISDTKPPTGAISTGDVKHNSEEIISTPT